MSKFLIGVPPILFTLQSNIIQNENSILNKIQFFSVFARSVHYIPVRCAPVLAVLAVMHISCLLPDYCCWVCNCYCPCLTILVSIVLVLVFCLKLSLFLLEKLSGYSIVRSSLFCCVLYLTKSLIFCHFFYHVKTMRDIYKMWKRWRSGAVLLSLLTERNIS